MILYVIIARRSLSSQIGGIFMNDSDGSHSCQDMIHESIQEEPEDPVPRRLRLATCDVIGPRLIRV
jgi:hypothetical protein